MSVGGVRCPATGENAPNERRGVRGAIARARSANGAPERTGGEGGRQNENETPMSEPVTDDDGWVPRGTA